MTLIQRVFVVGALAATWAYAGPITFTFSSLGSGSIGGTAFTDAAYIITAGADTANRVSASPFADYSIVNDFASITIAGLGTYDFLTGTQLWTVSGWGGGLGWYSGNPQNPISSNLLDVYDLTFAAWDLISPLGPITTPFTTYQWTLGGSVMTTGGRLILDDAVNDGTFQASTSQQAVPEPTTMVLCGVLLAFGGSVRFLRRR